MFLWTEAGVFGDGARKTSAFGSVFLLRPQKHQPLSTKTSALSKKFQKTVEKNKKNIYNENINKKQQKREGSDFYENKNNRKGTKDNRSNQ